FFFCSIDSIQLLEEGYTVVSTDSSEPMLTEARNERQRRQHDAAFNNWVIEKANWLTLPQDLRRIDGLPKAGFDVVLCLGNSFATLPDFECTKRQQKLALFNMFAMVKPGGIFVLDHRNYDVLLDTGSAPKQDVYYKDTANFASVETSLKHANDQPVWVTRTYKLRHSVDSKDNAKEEATKTTGNR
ncbi:Glycine N-methyltransferase, partial [Lamellibrachia satsuma]